MGIKGMKIERRPSKVLWPLCAVQYESFLAYRREINSSTALGYMSHDSTFTKRGWRDFR